MHSRITSQISPTFGKIPRKFPEKFGIQSKCREFSPNFGNLVKISGIWIEYSSEFYEHFSDLNITVKHWNTTEFFNLLKFYGILVIPTEILNLAFEPDPDNPGVNK